jgi:hypothetical protein
MSTELSIKERRRAFAIGTARAIRDHLQEVEREMWRAAAKRAKASGLYAASTYDMDAANGLRTHAGLRYTGVVRYHAEQAGGGA